MGYAIGYIIPEIGWINIDSDSGIFVPYSIQSIFGVFLTILVLFTFKAEPEWPPSKMASVDRDDDIIGTVCLLLTDKAFLKVSFAFSFYLTAILTCRENFYLLNQEFGYSESETTVFLYMLIFGGIIGIFFVGIILHTFR